MLAAHLADPLARRYDLEYLLGRKLNVRRKTLESAEVAQKESQLSMFDEAEIEDQNESEKIYPESYKI